MWPYLRARESMVPAYLRSRLCHNLGLGIGGRRPVRMNSISRLWASLLVGAVVIVCSAAAQQSSNPSVVDVQTAQPQPKQAQPTSSDSQAPVVITLHDALQRARNLDTTYRTALTAAGVAREDHVQAHADVIKAQLTANDTQRALQDAQLAMDRSHIELAVLVFPDFNQNFSTVDDLRLPPPLPPMQEVEQQAKAKNPQLYAAMQALRAASLE